MANFGNVKQSPGYVKCSSHYDIPLGLDIQFDKWDFCFLILIILPRLYIYIENIDRDVFSSSNGWNDSTSSISSSSRYITVEVSGLGEKLLEIEDGPIVNPHNFNYKLNPGSMICSLESASQKPLILIYIHSDPSHDKRRLLIRETWGSPYNFKDFEIRTIFLCGITNNNTMLQEALELEYDRYRDIVQEDFIDTYRNLTYKGIMALKWISQNCMKALLILKADDDIFLNIFKLMSRLNTIMHDNGILKSNNNNINNNINKDINLFMCNVWDRMMVIRDPKSKWYVSEAEFPENYFGRYCSGSAYAYTTSMVPMMFRMSRHVPFFWVDDYYITGLLPSKMKIPVKYEEINRLYFLAPGLFLEKFSMNDGDGEESRLAIGHSHNINQFLAVWRMVLKKYANATMS
ncbi:hypothetical protein HELRODRAFT_174600 [Helobdella robusta]|uniref:Hexosyltransferase n=1 Tax=Helobdella robusta TaxID=6412 RepID=T1F8A6_HELRO|nr:hypothetical protein HELRODRAFT_174600 [Helobdella robusta]ESO01642.1 hypothetical protein HELRODRAFT_174600 [Helobdella robusta]